MTPLYRHRHPALFACGLSLLLYIMIVSWSLLLGLLYPCLLPKAHALSKKVFGSCVCMQYLYAVAGGMCMHVCSGEGALMQMCNSIVTAHQPRCTACPQVPAPTPSPTRAPTPSPTPVRHACHKSYDVAKYTFAFTTCDIGCRLQLLPVSSTCTLCLVCVSHAWLVCMTVDTYASKYMRPCWDHPVY